MPAEKSRATTSWPARASGNASAPEPAPHVQDALARSRMHACRSTRRCTASPRRRRGSPERGGPRTPRRERPHAGRSAASTRRSSPCPAVTPAPPPQDRRTTAPVYPRYGVTTSSPHRCGEQCRGMSSPTSVLRAADRRGGTCGAPLLAITPRTAAAEDEARDREPPPSGTLRTPSDVLRLVDRLLLVLSDCCSPRARPTRLARLRTRSHRSPSTRCPRASRASST